jgi:hypothetical protein
MLGDARHCAAPIASMEQTRAILPDRGDGGGDRIRLRHR